MANKDSSRLTITLNANRMSQYSAIFIFVFSAKTNIYVHHHKCHNKTRVLECDYSINGGMTLHLPSSDVIRDRVGVNTVVKLASINCCLYALPPTAAMTCGNTFANTQRFARFTPAGVGTCKKKNSNTKR